MIMVAFWRQARPKCAVAADYSEGERRSLIPSSTHRLHDEVRQLALEPNGTVMVSSCGLGVCTRKRRAWFRAG
jgi:hypothetical protein